MSGTFHINLIVVSSNYAFSVQKNAFTSKLALVMLAKLSQSGSIKVFVKAGTGTNCVPS